MIKKEDIRPGADLRYEDLRDVDLIKANLSKADLYYANLSDANLMFANLKGANLRRADLRYADLRGANLSGADLREANLTDTKGLPPMKCPEKGSYVAYKKAEIWKKDHYVEVIVTLEIPAGAKRSSATTKKCRCSEATVLSIESLDGSKMYKRATAFFDHDFVYKVGKTVKVDDFDDDRWAECAPGIHHFMSREEAEEYCI